ncbi:VOC family protein [Halobacterium litoreum]|uniref:VOC family protein n=1 Tax=Halobacterium litoreum TaxID=2039234 RepID=A0ABD5NC20_9EURY|nr:VOC family protein [Halobacterium litoreum]UHH14291.1 VOC family protein [Halobacterium litoreum]
MRPVIDHVPFAGASHDALVERFETAGFSPDYGGEHPDAGTEMSALVFPDGSYLELVAPTRDDPAWWGDFFEYGDPVAGPSDWCIESGSVHAECQRVIDHDVEVHGPSHGSRERPDGTVVEWDNAFLGPPDEHLLPFVVTDRTPREYRVPDADNYGAPVSGIDCVVLATEDLESAVDRFRRLYRFPNPEYDYDDAFGDLASFPGQDVVLCEPTDGELRERVDRFGPCPATVLLTADVDDAVHQHPLDGGREWFERRVRMVEGLAPHLGVVSRN